ncbi:unnamed protein product [Mytilus edulis]|uniref:Integrase catalytic domain-containing protein n=1 Tax=Mytilus edulis TaxID=6550 RepID=A0A8S3TQ64_MYTED|nr:unnamed protein product [Mytilus edulis]
MLLLIIACVISASCATKLNYKFVGEKYDPNPLDESVWKQAGGSAGYFPHPGPRYMPSVVLPRPGIVNPRNTYVVLFESPTNSGVNGGLATNMAQLHTVWYDEEHAYVWYGRESNGRSRRRKIKLKSLQEATRYYFDAILDTRNATDDILCYYWEDQTGAKRWKICTPKALQGYVLWHLHDSPTGGHQGINRTKKRAALCPFFWPHMNLNIQDYVTTCDICEERKQPARSKRHKMKSYVMGTRFRILASDIAGPLPTTDQGNRYILVIQDYFTKFTEVYPLCDINAETVANVFLKGWIKRYGCPVEIHSDQGTQYESQLFQGICKLLHISKTRTTAMHPRSDGMVERGNRTIKEMLYKYIDRNQSDWDKYIDYMVMAYSWKPG